MDLFDFLLGIVWLAVVPLFLAAYGGHLAAQTLPDLKVRRRKTRIFWGSFIVGVVIASIYQYRVKKIDDARELRIATADAQRQKKMEQAQQAATEAQADLKALEKSNGDQILWLQKRLDKVITAAQTANEKTSAQEIKDELAQVRESLNKQVNLPPPTIAIPLPSVQPAGSVTPVRECRADDLKDCSDEDLANWGKPLVEQIEKIEDAHMAALKALDDITGSWALAFFGKDKDSKWLKAYAEAQQNTADQFRNCCAENALRYHNELVSRVGNGVQDNDTYEWVQKLLKPIKSKEWKNARSEAGTIIHVVADLNFLESRLNLRISRSKPRQISH